MDQKKFNFIKEKYGLLASWAVWAEAGDKPKSNMGDLSIFDDPDVINSLNENIILSEHEDMNWLKKNDLKQLKMAPGDSRIIKYL